MKKITLLISSILVIVLLVGCTESDKPKNPSNADNVDHPDKNVSEEVSLSSYYPIKENTKYIYQGEGNEYASYEAYTMYTEENKVQRRIDNGGTVSAEIIEVGDEEITKIFSQAEVYYREDLMRDDILNSYKEEDKEVLLKAPIKEGNSWKLNDGRTRTITNIASDLTTEGNTYKAVEVTTEASDGSKTIDYYAKDIGLVKSLYVAEGMEVSSSLKEIEEDSVFTQKIKFFYPDIVDDKIKYKEEDVDFKTNDISRVTLEKSYKQALNSTESVVLSENTKINHLYLNKDGMVYIDLNKAFVNDMNAGSGYESMILSSLATTFGNYYGVDKVVLTIDGGNYESGHIVLGKDEYLNVDKNVTSLD